MNEDPRAGIPQYAELRSLSNFSFLKGASWPEELVERAKQLGYSAIAVCDECSMAGAVRAHTEGKERGIHVIHGSQFAVDCDSPFTLVVLACNIEGYGNLCEFITGLRRSAAKGTYHLTIDAIDPAALVDCVVLVSPDRESTDDHWRPSRAGCWGVSRAAAGLRWRCIACWTTRCGCTAWSRSAS